MNMTRNEAQQSLETIHQVQREIRRTLAIGGAPFYMMLWGAIWFLGYLGSHFLPPKTAGDLWGALVAMGFILSFVIGWKLSTKVRTPGYDARIGIFWLLWIIYTFLIVWLGGFDSNPTLMSLFISIMAMFGYVVMGLWLWTPLTWIGLGVTVIIVLAYILVPAYINLVMAVLGGGVLFFSGLYIYRSWR